MTAISNMAKGEAAAALIRLEEPIMKARLSAAILFYLIEDLFGGHRSTIVEREDAGSRGTTRIEMDGEYENAIIWFSGEAADYARNLDDEYHRLTSDQGGGDGTS